MRGRVLTLCPQLSPEVLDLLRHPPVELPLPGQLFDQLPLLHLQGLELPLVKDAPFLLETSSPLLSLLLLMLTDQCSRRRGRQLPLHPGRHGEVGVQLRGGQLQEGRPLTFLSSRAKSNDSKLQNGNIVGRSYLFKALLERVHPDLLLLQLSLDLGQDPERVSAAHLLLPPAVLPLHLERGPEFDDRLRVPVRRGFGSIPLQGQGLLQFAEVLRLRPGIGRRENRLNCERN